MISSDSDSDIDSSGQGNEPSLNSEGVGPGGVPRKRGAKRNELEDGEVDDSEGDPEAKQTRKRHRVSSGSKKADAGDRARYLVDDEAEESGDEVGSDEDEESGEFIQFSEADKVLVDIVMTCELLPSMWCLCTTCYCGNISDVLGWAIITMPFFNLECLLA